MQKELLQALGEIQAVLKCPKTKFNQHSKFFYRSLEDIENAVKPLLHERGLFMYYKDELKGTDANPYLETTLIISDGENQITTTGLAGVDILAKGMSRAQAYGASSSYARKYAANAMFLIDDTKDDDVVEAPQNPNAKPIKEYLDKIKAITIMEVLEAFWHETYPLLRGTKDEKTLTDAVVARKNEILKNDPQNNG